MGLFSDLRFALTRSRGGGRAVACPHVGQILDVEPAWTGCRPCTELGDTWVHLRMCLTDGQVLCCDSSKNRHASRHAAEHAPEHQIARSMEPGEDWRWCYTDKRTV